MFTVIIGNSGMEQPAPAIGLLEANGFEVRKIADERFGAGGLSNTEEIEYLQGAVASLAWGERYPAAVIDELPDLRVIARLGVGFDKVDLRAATANKVAVTITPNSNHEAVAEHALAFILSLAKSIPLKDRMMSQGEWPNDSNRPIRGATRGIVGLGRIGRSLAVRASAMKMRIIAFEPAPDLGFVERNSIELVDLDKLLRESEYVSLHLPLNDATRGMIDREKLELMQSTACLINTARGGLVVEKDLIDALKSGAITGVGTDVFEQEPTPVGNPLLQLDNVIASPHIAGTDNRSMDDMGLEAAQYVIDLLDGRWPEGAVVNGDVRQVWNS